MGVNVKGLYTFGSPRAGNHAFVHDLRVRAFDRGMKIPKGEGNLARFVHHLDEEPLAGFLNAVLPVPDFATIGTTIVMDMDIAIGINIGITVN